MLYYSPLSGRNSKRRRTRDLMLMNILHSEVTKPFQADYSDFISTAVSFATKEKSGQFTLDVASTICTIKTPTLNLYVVQYAPLANYAGWADIALLQDKTSKAYIVLHGEQLKRYLESGISGFRLPLKKSAIEETVDIIAKWNAFSNEIKVRNSYPNAYRRGKIISELKGLITPMNASDVKSTVRKLNRVYGKKLEWVSNQLV